MDGLEITARRIAEQCLKAVQLDSSSTRLEQFIQAGDLRTVPKYKTNTASVVPRLYQRI
jgi:hypothetical protein